VFRPYDAFSDFKTFSLAGQSLTSLLLLQYITGYPLLSHGNRLEIVEGLNKFVVVAG